MKKFEIGLTLVLAILVIFNIFQTISNNTEKIEDFECLPCPQFDWKEECPEVEPLRIYHCNPETLRDQCLKLMQDGETLINYG